MSVVTLDAHYLFAFSTVYLGIKPIMRAGR